MSKSPFSLHQLFGFILRLGCALFRKPKKLIENYIINENKELQMFIIVYIHLTNFSKEGKYKPTTTIKFLSLISCFMFRF